MRHKNFSYAKYGYIFSLPFIIAFACFSLYPLVFTIVISFTDLHGVGATEINILDDLLKNFKDLLANNTFRKTVGNTFFIWFMNFIPQLFLALLLTAWFTSRNTKIRGQGLFKVLFYMPNIITAASIAILFGRIFMYPSGPMNEVLELFGKDPVRFTDSSIVTQMIIAFIQFWMWYGYTMLILISGVLGLNPEMYESADIDGANGVQQFFFITLPNLRTIMLFTLITSLIGGLSMFDIPQLFNNGQPRDSTYTTSMFIYNKAFKPQYSYSLAAAASLIMFVVIAALSIGVFYIMRDKDAALRKKQEKAARRALKAKGVS